MAGKHYVPTSATMMHHHYYQHWTQQRPLLLIPQYPPLPTLTILDAPARALVVVANIIDLLVTASTPSIDQTRYTMPCESILPKLTSDTKAY